MPEDTVTTISRKTPFYYDTYANLPTTNVIIGALGYATDRKVIYRWSGTAWQETSIHSSSGTIGNIPAVASMPEGSLYYATDELILYQVQTGVWTAIVTPYNGANMAIQPSDTLRNSNDAEKTNTTLVYVKVKETKVNAALIASRIKFTLQSTGGYTAYGRIYKNGVAWGTERSVANTTTTFSEDFGAIAANDLIQIYAKVDLDTFPSNITNFRFYYTKHVTGFGSDDLDTVLSLSTDVTVSMTNQDP